MLRWILIFLTALTIALGLTPPNVQAQNKKNIFFLHHSTGRHLIAEGTVRTWIDDYNQSTGSDLVLWDHDYNSIGLMDPDGVIADRFYNIPDDNTDPDGLYQLWTTSNSARDSILANHEVVAFKSCYPASDIGSDAELAQYKTWYLEMRDFFDTQPATTFIVMSMPPLHPLVTNVEDADRARAFANWLESEEYLAGHENLRCFNLFTLWAHPDDGSAERNMLRSDYVRSQYDSDSHPNDLANETVGPIFAEFLTEATIVPTEKSTWGDLKSSYR